MQDDYIRQIIEENRYLNLATCQDSRPWVATLEYLFDADLNLYFFSPENSRHVRDLLNQSLVAVSIFSSTQPDYEPGKDFRIAGIQMQAVAERLSGDYPDVVKKAIELWQLPMPPYAACRIRPVECWVPWISNGINERRKA